MLKSLDEQDSSNLNNYIFCGPDCNGQLHAESIIAEVLYEAGKVKSKEIVALSQEALGLKECKICMIDYSYQPSSCSFKK